MRKSLLQISGRRQACGSQNSKDPGSSLRWYHRKLQEPEKDGDISDLEKRLQAPRLPILLISNQN